MDSQMQTRGTGPPPLPKDLGSTSCSKCTPTDDELQRLALGYKRLKYLLDNWESETTICIRGCKGSYENCGCLRDPLVVQSYMGFKSMKDPLFKIDQIMIKAQPLVTGDQDKYAEAVERWVEKANDGNVMAYVSSWGEANPGGGESEVRRYLEKSRKGVVESVDILKVICDSLDIKV